MFADVDPLSFGSFFHAFVTMYAAMVKVGWPQILRNLLFNEARPEAALFFVFYIFIVGIILVSFIFS